MTESTKKKGGLYKDLPPSLEVVVPNKVTEFVCAVEVDPNGRNVIACRVETYVAQRFKALDNSLTSLFTLNADQL